MKQLPREDIIYLGDTAHLPYGTKSASTIIRFTLDNILFLLKQNVKFVVVACNTASSIALDTIRKHFRLPVIGVIQPGAREAVHLSKTKCVGVIGTYATISSKAYEKEIKKIKPKIKVISQICPLFVPLVEEGWLKQSATLIIAERYLRPLLKRNKKMDTLILGCTHYPLLKPVIRKILGRRIKLIDSAQAVAREVSQILDTQSLCNVAPAINGRCKFYVTDNAQGFTQQAVRFLGHRISQVKIKSNVRD